MQNKWFRIISFGLVAFGAFAITKGKLLIGIGVVIAGIAVYRRLSTKTVGAAEKNDFQLTDNMIVRFANLRGGIISANELASQTSLDVEQAKVRLEKLVQQELVSLRVSDSGNILYDFKKNNLDWREKNNAEII